MVQKLAGTIWLLTLIVSRCAGAEDAKIVQALQTPAGIKFGLLGTKGQAPAPTLFVFATDFGNSLRAEEFNKIGRLLAKDGVLCVSLDVPCHGKDQKSGEPGGIGGWRNRLEKGDTFVPAFTTKASAVLDHLIKEGYTDSSKVAACGTSRGGFIALHFAAAELRVRSVVAFAPVIDLLALREFSGMKEHAATKSLNLIQHADKLAKRRVWLCIGNQDVRVNTDDAIAFTRAVVRAAGAPNTVVPVELLVMPTMGHSIHATAHAEAAAFVRAGMK